MRFDAVATLQGHFGLQKFHALGAVGDHQTTADLDVKRFAAIILDLLPQADGQRPQRQRCGGRTAALLSLGAEVEGQQLYMQAAGVGTGCLQIEIVAVDDHHLLAG